MLFCIIYLYNSIAGRSGSRGNRAWGPFLIMGFRLQPNDRREFLNWRIKTFDRNFQEAEALKILSAATASESGRPFSNRG